MDPEEGAERIREELWRCFARAGRGSIQDTQRQLGVGKSYFRDLKRGKTLDVVMLLATLKVLGEEPSAFFVRALSPLELEPPTGETPRIVQLAQARVEELKEAGDWEKES